MVHGVNTECIQPTKPTASACPCLPMATGSFLSKTFTNLKWWAFNPPFGLVVWHLHPELGWDTESAIFTGSIFVILKC